jgi:hypothetical protein
MQQRLEHLAGHIRTQHGRQMVGTTRSSLQGGKPLLVEGVDSMANGLFVAGEGLCNGRDRFPTSGSQQDLAATEHKGVRGTQSSTEYLVFLFGKVADKNAWVHESEYTTFRIIFLENGVCPQLEQKVGIAKQPKRTMLLPATC